MALPLAYAPRRMLGEIQHGKSAKGACRLVQGHVRRALHRATPASWKARAAGHAMLRDRRHA
eukprot:CAMPEP_0171224310 /NCGR_PEP_ID=MMETSP0790-20130122/36222_1 /TAXON_ID=2925 /ORGANISM="Alexandrium catenella, Strain OF101" /LENGTH=61 /DNA_ID=CAMNT_0011690301 /DNA_START=48 /DNA_END=229 /DNA_ORIENTATION=-